MLFRSCAFSLALAWPYAYVVLYLPLIYINFIITAFFAGLVGAISVHLLKKRQVRNTAVAMAVAFLVTVFAFYCGWTVWLYAFARRAGADVRILPLLLNPVAVWEIVILVNRNGAWSLRGSVPKGAFLWTIWGLDAALVFGVSLFMAWTTMGSEPYCENCGQWCEGKDGVAKVKGGGSAELKQRLEAGDFGYLEGLGGPPADAMEWHLLDLHTCERCRMTSTLTARAVTRKMKQGKPDDSIQTLVNKLSIGSGDADTVRRLGEKLAAAAAAEALAAAAAAAAAAPGGDAPPAAGA